VLQHHRGPLPLHHADLYRLSHEAELDEIGVFALSLDGLLVAEWADRFAARMPASTLWLRLERAPHSTLRRRIHACALDDRSRALRDAARSVLARGVSAV
jgi:tRNA A37 threonylcarbamoyladenosine biosynthesis protein TsaE